MGKTWYIYGHWTLDTNELFYIGIGSRSDRKTRKAGRNEYWHNIVNKHGYEAIVILDGFTDRDEVVMEEIRLQQISKPRACLMYGDSHNQIVSEESRANMRRAWLTRPPMTNETKDKISKSAKITQLGSGNSMAVSVINCRGHIFSTAIQAAKNYGMATQSHIIQCCKNKSLTAGKYPDGIKIKWKYNNLKG